MNNLSNTSTPTNTPCCLALEDLPTPGGDELGMSLLCGSQASAFALVAQEICIISLEFKARDGGSFPFYLMGGMGR